MISTIRRTFYTVETYALRKFEGSTAYWSCMGSGPGGATIDQARERVKKEIERIGADRLDSDVKFVITKTIETTEKAEEVLGSEVSFFMLQNS